MNDDDFFMIDFYLISSCIVIYLAGFLFVSSPRPLSSRCRSRNRLVGDGGRRRTRLDARRTCRSAWGHELVRERQRQQQLELAEKEGDHIECVVLVPRNRRRADTENARERECERERERTPSCINSIGSTLILEEGKSSFVSLKYRAFTCLFA